MIRPFAALLLAALCAEATSAQVVTLVPTRDNTLYETDVSEGESGELSNGVGQFVFAGRSDQKGNTIRRALIHFDVAGALPPDAIVTEARLDLEMNLTIAGATDVELRRLTADWGEGTSDATSGEGGGAPATAGDATWPNRFFPGSPWASPGGDFLATVSATTSVDQVGSYSWGSTPQMVADVQDWLDNPGGNFGWILIGDESTQPTAKRFASRENPSPLSAPALVITFGQPSVLEVPAIGAWGMLALVLVLGAAAVLALRRRRPHAS